MNILIIGNGFDLAHELPTKYTDFLEFCKMISTLYDSEELTLDQYKIVCLDYSDLNIEIKKQLFNVFKSRKAHKDINDNGEIIYTFTTDYPKSDELYALIQENIWIEYFGKCDMHGDENWIDFESEISEVIQSLDNDMHGLNQLYNIDDIVKDLSNNFLEEMYSDYIDAVQQINPVDNSFSGGITLKKIRDKLLIDLNKRIRAFEIYLTEYVEKIDCRCLSPDIQKILPKEVMKLNGSPVYDGLYILSFNYTDTFQRLYIDKKYGYDYAEKNIDYIHGKANISNTIETNNMVLGIDEYLGKKERNRQIEFIAFKKFYQRIHKGTGCKYKEWTDSIREEFADYQTELEKCKTEKNIMLVKAATNKLKQQYLNKHHVYIFGHSLDVTDKDILRDLILNDNIHTTIFYHNKDAMGKQIANLVKVIGQKELIRRTGGKDILIEFKLQQPMIKRVEDVTDTD